MIRFVARWLRRISTLKSAITEMTGTLKIRPGRVPLSQMNDRETARFLSSQEVLGLNLGDKLSWDASTNTLVIDGSVTADAGVIGGWTLAATYLQSGTGANTVRLDSGGTNPAISAGSATPASAPFRVTQAGALTATNATITGAVTATSGAIGGWTLGATALSAGSGATTVGIDSGGTNPAFYAGSATPGSAPFRVTQAGALTATSATITGTITLTNAAQTFTPSGWVGFSTDPTGDISYLDFGPFVVMWVNSALTGVSDEVFMSFSTGMPVGIRPTAQRDVRCVLLDESFVCGGVTRIDSSGAVAFFLEEVQAGTPPPANTVGFNNIFTDPSSAGFKGLPSGWMVIYPK